jgi:hypothetical protein
MTVRTHYRSRAVLPSVVPPRGVIRQLSARHLEIEAKLRAGVPMAAIAMSLGIQYTAVQKAKAKIEAYREWEELTRRAP